MVNKEIYLSSEYLQEPNGRIKLSINAFEDCPAIAVSFTFETNERESQAFSFLIDGSVLSGKPITDSKKSSELVANKLRCLGEAFTKAATKLQEISKMDTL